MGTVVAFHAHPDDESLIMGGSLARASREGHRVVLVVATNGDHGQIPDDLAPGETLMDRRKRETQASCDVLGIHRLVWLGYCDSGMTGWEQNELPGAFVAADVEEAALRLADVLIEEHAGALPIWLAPVQVSVLNITEAQADYCREITKTLQNQGLRVHLDLKNEKITYKIREHSMQKVPYLLVVGDKEKDAAAVAVRARGNKDLGVMSLEAFAAQIASDIAHKA